MSENRFRGSEGGSSEGKTNRGNPRSWLGPALVISFVVSVAGEAYAGYRQEVQIGNPSMNTLHV